MTDTIFVDMDGTIVDYFMRFHSCYLKTMNEMGIKTEITLPEFIKNRRSGSHMFDFQREDFPKFASIFDNMIESREALANDTIIPGMYSVIKTLFEKTKNHDICVVSYRANRPNLLNQLHNLGLGEFTSAICMPFSTKHRPGKKADLIREYDDNPSGYIIGDDVYEVAAGKELGLKTISVSWGSRSSEVLRGFSPDHIVDKPEQILEIIK